MPWAPRRPPFERTRRVAALGLTLAFGCAKQVDTLDPLDEIDADEWSVGGASKGGSSSAGAHAGSAGKPSGGSTTTNAFGGSATSGSANGSSGRGAAAGGGGSGASQDGGTSSQGGGTSSQAGSNQGGGGAGTAGRGGTGSSGGRGGDGGSVGSGGAIGSGCLTNWRDNAACDTCTTQTQSDKKACAQVLDCYLQNACGPTTCAANDDECGANTIQQGTAPYPIAQDVYNCLCK